MEQLEKYFDTAFGAPDGVKKLRELILTVAMQGKLVPQNPKDLPAIKLLEKINLENKKLSKEGKISLPKILKEVSPSEEPYTIPPTWKWVRLNELGIWKSGLTPSRQNYKFYGGNIPWIKSGEVKQGNIKHAEETITAKALESTSIHINPIGSVLLAMYGANIGDVGILEIDASTNQAVCACQPYWGISNEFLVCLIKSLKQNFISQGAGAAQPNISREKIINTIVPLPPPEEQLRIVLKINELMSRCDELEKLRVESDQKRLDIHTAAIRKLLDAPDQASFDRAWKFITRHFGELYSVKENVAELRKAILQLAVMGRLVPQDPKEGTARELLEEIEKEKRKLVKEGKMKELKPLSSISLEEIPFEVPKGWQWVRFGTIIELVSGQHLTPNDYNETREGFSYYTGPADFQELNPKPSRWTKIDRAIALDGDILLTVKGAGVGKTNILTEEKAAISRQLMAIRVIFANREYTHIFLKSIFYEFQGMAIGIAIPGISREDVLQKCIPLPPLAEQNRIMQKAKKLMNICDNLENKITRLKSKRGEILGVIFRS